MCVCVCVFIRARRRRPAQGVLPGRCSSPTLGSSACGPGRGHGATPGRVGRLAIATLLLGLWQSVSRAPASRPSPPPAATSACLACQLPPSPPVTGLSRPDNGAPRARPTQAWQSLSVPRHPGPAISSARLGTGRRVELGRKQAVGRAFLPHLFSPPPRPPDARPPRARAGLVPSQCRTIAWQGASRARAEPPRRPRAGNRLPRSCPKGVRVVAFLLVSSSRVVGVLHLRVVWFVGFAWLPVRADPPAGSERLKRQVGAAPAALPAHSRAASARRPRGAAAYSCASTYLWASTYSWASTHSWAST